jgi:hypothetical protein
MNDNTHSQYQQAFRRRNFRGVSRQISGPQTDQARTVDMGSVGRGDVTTAAKPADAPADKQQWPTAPAWRTVLMWMYRVFVAEHWRT